MSDNQEHTSVDAYSARRGLSFGQAEGVEPLPRQLDLREISQELRAYVWAVFVLNIEEKYNSVGSNTIESPWRKILLRKWVYRDFRPMDDFPEAYQKTMAGLKNEMETTDYVKFFGVLQWLLEQPDVTRQFYAGITVALQRARSAYRVVDGGLIVPLADEASARAFNSALDQALKTGFAGAHSHLSAAGRAATSGAWADSVRESIHAVESVAKLLVPGSDTLGPALSFLERSGKIHGSMKSGFGSLYGWTSDQEGIRHALLEKGDASVDEADAIFMLGACASFVSYLITKGRSAEQIKA